MPRSRPVTLSPHQRDRYHRHLLLPEVGEAGQLKLLCSRALVVGAGGLGSPIALYLAAAGVGRLGLVDMDAVELSNLQRQVLHNIESLGQPKVASAKQALGRLNPEVDVVTYDVPLGMSNVASVLAGYDVAVMAVDNFAARYVVNDAALALGVPVVHGGIYRFEGHVTVCLPDRGPCYRCHVPEAPPDAMMPMSGPLGALAGVIGCIQATEAIKLLLDLGEPLVGRLLTYDALEGTFRTFRVRRDPACPTCGARAGGERTLTRGTEDKVSDHSGRASG